MTRSYFPALALTRAFASIALAADGATASASASASTAATQSIKAAGFDLEIPAPYAAGHPLTPNEAAAFNQLFAENVRNNTSSRVKSAKEAFEKDEANAGKPFSIDTPRADGTSLRQELTTYAETYEFGARVARTSEPVDPVQREAHRIARDTLDKALKAGGHSKKTVGDEKYAEMLKIVAAKDEIQKEAKRRVKAAGDIGLAELGLGDPAPASTEGASPAA